MDARQLRRVMTRALALVSPLATGVSLTQLSACFCSDERRSELRELELPPGWTRSDDAVRDGEHVYYGSPDDPEIDSDACNQLCQSTVDGCRIIVQCEPPAGEGGADSAGFGCDSDALEVPFDFYVVCEETYAISCGRRPHGMRPMRARGASAVGAYFAELTQLEAASIDAFAILRDQLRAHEAPASLLRAAAIARRDEQRHTRVMNALAHRFGGLVPRRRSIPIPSSRSLRDIAVENVREGCVRETFGAASALWQASHAQDRRVRAALRHIAEDEIRHGALAWRVASWAESRLSATDRAAVRHAREDAWQTLERELAAEPPAELVHIAGVPRASVARSLLARLGEQLPS